MPNRPARNEAKTRQELIDPALKKAGWDMTNHAQQRESERQGEHLFQSLLHGAFRGEI